jgi:hypothetical protein
MSLVERIDTEQKGPRNIEGLSVVERADYDFLAEDFFAADFFALDFAVAVGGETVLRFLVVDGDFFADTGFFGAMALFAASVFFGAAVFFRGADLVTEGGVFAVGFLRVAVMAALISALRSSMLRTVADLRRRSKP